jgi:diacylglycerol kinase
MISEHHPRHHYRSLTHAWRGLYNTLISSSGRNLRLELGIAVVALILAYYFQFDMTKQMIVIATALLVLGFEMVNTAIEEIVNELHPEKHPLAKAAKDAAAASVLIIALLATVIGLYLYFPPIVNLFGY